MEMDELFGLMDSYFEKHPLRYPGATDGCYINVPASNGIMIPLPSCAQFGRPSNNGVTFYIPEHGVALRSSRCSRCNDGMYTQYTEVTDELRAIWNAICELHDNVEQKPLTEK